MVTTRRQSKTFDPPTLQPVGPPKRKRRHDAAAAQSAAQLPKPPSTKRRKKVKSTAKVASPAVAHTVPALIAQNEKTRNSSKVAKRKASAKTAQARKAIQPDTNLKTSPNFTKPAQLGMSSKCRSSEDEAPQQTQAVVPQDADDEDADSRYALAPKRRRNARPTVLPARPTAELKFEEDGLEEMDKAQAAVAEANNRASTQRKSELMAWAPTYESVTVKNNKTSTPQVGAEGRGLNKEHSGQVNGKRKGNVEAAQTTMSPAGFPSKLVMFTVVEAIATLSLYKDGIMSLTAEIDPESRQPYKPLKTGEYLSYPVKGNYYLGGIGRYDTDTRSSTPFSLTVPLTSHSLIESTTTSLNADSSRHGLGFAALPTLPARPKGLAVRRPNNYCFTFGKYRGRRMDSVPISYLRSIFEGDEYYADAKLQQAFTDLYPKGLYESETESFTFEKGGFKGKRFDEVPKSYLWGLVRKKNSGEDVGGKKGRGRLERALEVWERDQLDLTKD